MIEFHYSMEYKNSSITKAFDWLAMQDGNGFLLIEEHCPTRDIFQGRLDHMSREMEKIDTLKEMYPLLVAITGELGNNSFDHNLGNWRDEKGVYFVYNLEKKFVVIADRGQGMLATLKPVAPELQTESEAIKLAFTKIISGRAPEQRGNGLKFVESVVRAHHLKVHFSSGDGSYIINDGLHEETLSQLLHGVVAVFTF